MTHESDDDAAMDNGNQDIPSIDPGNVRMIIKNAPIASKGASEESNEDSHPLYMADAATDNDNQDVPLTDPGNDHQEHSSSIGIVLLNSL